MSAKLSACAALATTRLLRENVNCATKSSYLLGFLESVPEESAKIEEPTMKEKFEDVVKETKQAAVLVLVF